MLDAFWVIHAERIGYGPFFTTISLFANVLFILTALVLWNALIRRIAPRGSRHLCAIVFKPAPGELLHKYLRQLTIR